MDYSEFLKYVKSSIEKIVGNGCIVKIHTVLKNNDSELDALVITTQELGISPTIYLNDFYDEYIEGKPIATVIAEIYSLYKKHRISDDIDISFFKKYDMVRPTIAFKLINREKNKRLLEEVPYFKYLDLAIVFYSIISTQTISRATTLIRNEHLQMWGISNTYLLADAVENTSDLLPHRLLSLNEMMKEIMEEAGIFTDEITDSIYEDDMDIYVLTNDIRSNGAICIMYDDVLKDFAREKDADLIIIPSSVHEVIIIPKRSDMSNKRINQMVKLVNDETLEGYEVLSDHIYIYLKDEEKVIIPDKPYFL